MREQLIKCSEQPFDFSALLGKMEQHCQSSRGDGQAAVLRFTMSMLQWLASPHGSTVSAAQAASLASANVAGELAACRRRRNPINAMQSLDENTLSLDSSTPAPPAVSLGAQRRATKASSTFKRKQRGATAPPNMHKTWAEAEAAAGVGDFGIGGPTGSGSSSSVTLVKRRNKSRKISGSTPSRSDQKARSVNQRHSVHRVSVSSANKAHVSTSAVDSDADDFV